MKPCPQALPLLVGFLALAGVASRSSVQAACNFGPLVLSATVDSLATNRIELVFNEPLNSFTVHSPSVPAVLTNDTFRVVMFGSNVNVPVTNSFYLGDGIGVITVRSQMT